MKRLLLMLLCPVLPLAAQHTNILISNQHDPNEPSICINPKNTQEIVAGANIDNVYISTDGGNTWTDNTLTCPDYGVWGDPCIVTDTTGNFYFFHLSNPPVNGSWVDRIVCQRQDGALGNWTLGTATGKNGSKVQDKHWVVVDQNTNRIYTTWTQFDNYGSTAATDRSVILFSYSDDQGATWSTPLRISTLSGDCVDSDDTAEGAVPAVGPNGEVYVVWSLSDSLYFNKSLDHGATWLPHERTIGYQAGGWDYNIGGISRANGMPVTKCDLAPNSPHRGTLYVNYGDIVNGANDTDVWLIKSTDGGTTWSGPIRVNDDATQTHQFFTWMDIDQTTGYLWFVWYDRRAYPDYRTDVWMAVSTDGGDTFRNFKVSESSFLPNPNIFFGDYNNISAYNGVVRPMWTRMQNGLLSVLTAIVDTDLVLATETPLTEFNCEIDDAYPNPFVDQTAFAFKLRQADRITLRVVDVLGREITVLRQDETLPAGKYIHRFDAGSLNLSAGIYYFVLETSQTVKKRQIIYAP